MMARQDKSYPDDRTIDRRRLLQALGAASAAGLAGCTGEDDDDGADTPEETEGELGERVPEIQMEYWSDYGGFTTIQENMAPTIRNNVEDALGVAFEIVPVEFTAQISNTFEDQRTHDIAFFWHTNAPDRIDPNEMLRRMAIDWAGGNGNGNAINYASCEYSERALGQAVAESEEERTEMIYEAQEILSHDCVGIQLTPNPGMGAYRTDTVELDGAGDNGLVRTNAMVFIKSSATGGDDQLTVGVDPTMTQTRNYPTYNQGMAEGAWFQIINSPLIQFDEVNELQPVLAEDWEVVAPDHVQVELKDDATFHNGDPITPEDVKFTFEQLVRGSEAGAYPRATSPPYDEITVTGDHTVEFTFTEAYWPFEMTELARWGIMHRDSFLEAGADDSPGEAQFNEIVGSGPFQVTDFSQGSHVQTEPHDGHPTFDVDHGLFFQAYRNEETGVTALGEGEVDILPEISPGSVDRINDTIDDAEAHIAEGFMGFILYPQHPKPPNKFEAFRKAVAACINRQELAAIAFQGEVEPEIYANLFCQPFPQRAPDERLYKMADPEGSPDMAQDILRDAGWGWDGDGNLHYPPDADLSALWPEGEEPSEDDFPCLSDLR